MIQQSSCFCIIMSDFGLVTLRDVGDDQVVGWDALLDANFIEFGRVCLFLFHMAQPTTG